MTELFKEIMTMLLQLYANYIVNKSRRTALVKMIIIFMPCAYGAYIYE